MTNTGMDPLRSNTRSVFKWNKREKRGVIVLLFLMVIFQGTASFVEEFYSHDVDLEGLQPEFKAFDVKKDKTNKPPKATSTPVNYFFFDPNNASSEEFQNLGMPEFLAERIIKFRSAGGSFKRKSDLKKIYGLEESLYQKLEPWIRINEAKEEKPNEPKQQKTKPYKEGRRATVELQSLDTLEWTALRGIGPVLAGRIIKYGKSLGGYSDITQLREVYGISDSLFSAVEPFIEMHNTQTVTKLDLNTVSYEELIHHPYFRNRALCRLIVNYRASHGSYETVEAIKELHLMNDSIYQRIHPYIECKARAQ